MSTRNSQVALVKAIHIFCQFISHRNSLNSILLVWKEAMTGYEYTFCWLQPSASSVLIAYLETRGFTPFAPCRSC